MLLSGEEPVRPLRVAQGTCLSVAPEVQVIFILTGTAGVCGQVADSYHFLKTLGGKPELITVFGRDQGWVSSSDGAHSTGGWFALTGAISSCAGLRRKEISGGKWIVRRPGVELWFLQGVLAGLGDLTDPCLEPCGHLAALLE